MTISSSMWIRIGGTLAEEDVKPFAALVAEAGLAEDWGEEEEGKLRAEEAEDVLRTWDPTLPLALYDSEHPWGEVEDLELFLQDKGLTYARGDTGHDEWDAIVVFWQPGMAETKEWTGTKDGVPCLSWREIVDHLDAGTLAAELALMRSVLDFEFPFVAPKWEAATAAQPPAGASAAP